MRKVDKCDMEKLGTPDSSETTIAILGDRWWPQTTKQEGDQVTYGKKSVLSAQMLEVFQSGVGTVLLLERDAWSIVKCHR